MRRVLKRRDIVADDWRHLEEDPGAASGTHSVIVPLAGTARQLQCMVGTAGAARRAHITCR